MEEIVRRIKEEVKLPLAIHCHDDFGLATANTIFGVKAGAEEFHGTINGLGERAGNAAIEEVVIALEYLYGIKTKIKKEKLYNTSKLVEKLSRVVVPPNKPIVGDNAFTHESGIHTSASSGMPSPTSPSLLRLWVERE